jgi:hypothetical protein
VDPDLLHPAGDNLAASPKVRSQMRNTTGTVSTSTDPDLAKSPKDGIAASPKVRQQMRTTTTQPAQVEVAPISK